jgi:hypothetical protein
MTVDYLLPSDPDTASNAPEVFRELLVEHLSGHASGRVDQIANGQLYLAVEDIDHSRTKTKSTQTNGIVERFRKTLLDECYQVAFRKKIYRALAELQADLIRGSSATTRIGRIKAAGALAKPMQTFLGSLPLAKEKLMVALPESPLSLKAAVGRS